MLQNISKHPNYVAYTFAVIIASISAMVFYRIYYYSDIFLHADFVINHLDNKAPLPDNFLYYLMILIGAWGNSQYLFHSSIVVLTISVVAKYFISANFLKTDRPYKSNEWFPFLLAGILVLSSGIYIPQYIIFNRFYLGSITLNVWHNSTTIAVMPFAILLFQETIKQLKNYSFKRLLIIIALIIINAFIKPSYLFVYIGALPITLLFYRPNVKVFIKQIWPSAIALLVVIILKSIIYNGSQTVAVELNPFKVYKYSLSGFNTWQMVLFLSGSIVLGLLFPITAVFHEKLKRLDVDIIFSSIAMFGAIAMYILFAETGERWWHGNFYWQIVISSYILFLSFARKTYRQLEHFTLLNFNGMQIALILHLLFGLVYLLRLIYRAAYL